MQIAALSLIADSSAIRLLSMVRNRFCLCEVDALADWMARANKPAN